VDFSKYKEFTWMLDYKHVTVYRYWPGYTEEFEDFLAGKVKEIKVKQQPYYNTTLSLKALDEMIEEGGITDTGPITKHQGEGIDVMAVLKEAVPRLSKKDAAFVQSVIKNNEYQQEIFFTSPPITTLNKSNIVAYYDEKAGKVKKLPNTARVVSKSWDSLPKGWTEESVKSFWKSLTGDRKHKITQCIKKMTGDMDNPEAFCASLAQRVGYEPAR